MESKIRFELLSAAGAGEKGSGPTLRIAVLETEGEVVRDMLDAGNSVLRARIHKKQLVGVREESVKDMAEVRRVLRKTEPASVAGSVLVGLRPVRGSTSSSLWLLASRSVEPLQKGGLFGLLDSQIKLTVVVGDERQLAAQVFRWGVDVQSRGGAPGAERSSNLSSSSMVEIANLEAELRHKNLEAKRAKLDFLKKSRQTKQRALMWEQQAARAREKAASLLAEREETLERIKEASAHERAAVRESKVKQRVQSRLSLALQAKELEIRRLRLALKKK